MIRETEADRIAEERIASALAHLLPPGALWRKLPYFHVLDYAVTVPDSRLGWEPPVRCFFEAKKRHSLRYGFGEGYWISLNKGLRAEEIERSTRLRCYLAIELSNQCIYTSDKWLPSYLTTPRLIVNGRTDRNDPNDIEPLIVVPWDTFTQRTLDRDG